MLAFMVVLRYGQAGAVRYHSHFLKILLLVG